jgi:hypothetical protein
LPTEKAASFGVMIGKGRAIPASALDNERSFPFHPYFRPVFRACFNWQD